ncbi:unnamed protein product [Fraxinus pennsylvanica]|uniref:Protein LIKE COV 3 n=1 Tax=Fraxinus pennsylvanica TaxID=56036 RepID=A0AAD1ZYD1_9LAMI|nr:unnamed protein product [Fraxinus pennsylvanica]
MAARERDRDLELLLPVANITETAPPPPVAAPPRRLGFITSIIFIFLVGIFTSFWLGASLLSLGEWLIKKMPLISYIYSASKQISAAISPDESSSAFKEVAILRHPRIGEYTFGFITSTVVLQKTSGEEELCCVYIPTNHLYLGDILLMNSKDVIRPNLSVREGIEIVISGGTSVPKRIAVLDSQSIPTARTNNFGTWYCIDCGIIIYYCSVLNFTTLAGPIT